MFRPALLWVALALLVLTAYGARHPSREEPANQRQAVIPGLLELDEELDDALKINPLVVKMEDDKSVINDPDSQPLKATIYTYEDKQKFKKHPGKKTVEIVKALAKLKKQAQKDGTVDDIKRSWRLLEMYKVLKKEMLDMLKSTGQPLPDLPSMQKLDLDASGQPWGDAKMGQDLLAAALKQRDEDINYERSVMHYRALAESPKLRAAAKAAAALKKAKMLAKYRKAMKKTAPVTNRPDFCVPPGCVVLDCTPPACPANPVPSAATKVVQFVVQPQLQQSVAVPAVTANSAPTGFPVAPSGVPQGLHPWLKPTLPGQPLAIVPAASGLCTCQAMPSCPCAAPKVVSKLPPAPVAADEGKPVTVDLQKLYGDISKELSRARFMERRPPAATQDAAAQQESGSADCKPPLCYTG